MNQANQKILFVAYFNSHLPQFLQLVEFMQIKLLRKCIVLFVNDVEKIHSKNLKAFHDAGCTVIDRNGLPIQVHQVQKGSDGQAPVVRPETIQRSWAIRKLKRIPLIIPLYLFLLRVWEFITFTAQIAEHLRLSRKAMNVLNPALVILPEENAILHTSTYTRTAKRKGIPVLICPYTIANATEFAESNVRNPALWTDTGWCNRIVARFFPRWTYVYNNKKLLLLTWPRILGTELLGLTPPDPWMVNSGYANAIAVESRHMLRYYITNKLPKDELVLTGSLSDDTLNEVRENLTSRREELNKHYHLDPKKPIILVALPPPWFPRPGCDFPTFEALVNFWIDAVGSQQKYNVLVHLHPRLRYENLTYIEQRGVHIAQGDIVSLIPLADVFVASISATIRWAIACGIPVINYDVYKWGFHDYDTAGGVVTIAEQQDFSNCIQRVAQNSEYVRQLHEKQLQCASDWGMVDGQSGVRLSALVQRLLKPV